MNDKVEDAAEELPIALWSGSFRLYGVEVKVHTLSNGQRIIEADSMHQLMEAMGTVPHDEETIQELKRFASWQTGQDSQ